MKKIPTIDTNVFIAEGAKIVGNVQIAANCGIWFNAVLRADNEPITIGENSNVQDNAVIHMGKNYPVVIGKNVTIGHSAMVHGCTIEDNCIIGIGSIIMNGAHIGSGSIVGAGALVTENTIIPPGSIVMGTPGKVKRSCTDKDLEKIKKNALHYVELAKEYKEQT